MPWIQVQQEAPNWLMSQQDNNILNDRWGDLAANGNTARLNASHMCYAFAAVSVLIRLRPQPNINVQQFANMAGYPIGNGGIAYNTMKELIGANRCLLTIQNPGFIQQRHNNEFLQRLNNVGPEYKLALVNCNGGNGNGHVFIISRNNNILNLYNVWNRSIWSWANLNNGTPMEAFPDGDGVERFSPQGGAVYI